MLRKCKKNSISVFAIIVFASLAIGSTESDPKKPDAIGAKVMCESFMKKRLKSPGTANFAGPFDGVEGARHLGLKNNVHTYEINSWVDSQNSFGATVRTKFYCKISNVMGSDDWRLVELKF